MSAASPGGASARTSYREACRQAMRQALIADPRCFLMGEDVGRYGGCYGVTKGLLEVRDLLGDGGRAVADQFGDTLPMSESSPRGEFGPALEPVDQRHVGRAVNRVVHGTEPEPPPLAAVGIIREDETSPLAAKGARQVLHDEVAVAVADEGDGEG